MTEGKSTVESELLDLAVTLARAAGALLRDRFTGPQSSVETKSSATDMVTDADRAAERLILDGIRAVRPQDAVLGEESGEIGGSSGFRWVVDPLDGTTNFLYGIPQWAVSVACEDGRGVVAGVVYDPLRDELFAASRGGGATMNGEPIAVSGATDLARALVATGFSYRAEERAAGARMLARVVSRIRDVRRAGAAALDLAWVACGRLDGYYETPIAWWDVAAGILLVREAGGSAEPLPEGPAGPGWVAAGLGVYDELRAFVVASIEIEEEAAAR